MHIGRDLNNPRRISSHHSFIVGKTSCSDCSQKGAVTCRVHRNCLKMLTYAVISSNALPRSWSYKPSGYWWSGSESVLSRFLASFQRLEIKVHTDCNIGKKLYSEDSKAKWYCRSRSMPSRVTAATWVWVNPRGPTKVLWTPLYGFQLRRNWVWRGMMQVGLCFDGQIWIIIFCSQLCLFPWCIWFQSHAWPCIHP